MKSTTCEALDEYGKVPKTVPLDFTRDDITWVASKLSGAAGALGAEVIELRNWILCFGCASEELMVVVARLADLMPPPPPTPNPPLVAYCALMACRLVSLHKRPGVRPVGIGERSWVPGKDDVCKSAAVCRP